MKRILIALLFLAALTLAYLAGNSPAQQFAAAQPIVAAKVGIVDFKVLLWCDKVKLFKETIARDIQPFKAKQRQLEKSISDWQAILKNPDPRLHDANFLFMGRQKVIDCQRQLEDLNFTVQKQFKERLEKESAAIWDEIHAKIREYAEVHGFDMVLGHGEADLSPMQKVQTRLRTLDAGGIAAVCAGGGVDISAEVLSNLNNSFQAGQPVKNDQGGSQ